MTPDDTGGQILVGDVREMLSTLPDESVHLVMTSPPYWSLRDYGTGRWEGGSAECDHSSGRGTNIKQTKNPNGADYPAGAAHRGGNPNECARCGAVRVDQQMGMEARLDCVGWATGEPCGECWVCHMVAVLREVKRVLRPEGVCWWNVGDSYASGASGFRPGSGRADGIVDERGQRNRNGTPLSDGLKPKDMCLVPSRLALAAQQDGWWVRSMCPWVKRSAMPSSVQDRPSASLEWMIMLTKCAEYFWDTEAVRRGTIPDSRDGRWGSTKQTSRHGHEADAEQGMMQTRTQADGYVRMSNPSGRNLRDSDWWFDSVGMLLRDEVLGFDVVSEPSSDKHYASYPRRLVREVVLAGCPIGGVVLDPFCGRGTTGVVAMEYGRRFIGIELSETYAEMARRRLAAVECQPLLDVAAPAPAPRGGQMTMEP